MIHHTPGEESVAFSVNGAEPQPGRVRAACKHCMAELAGQHRLSRVAQRGRFSGELRPSVGPVGTRGLWQQGHCVCPPGAQAAGIRSSSPAKQAKGKFALCLLLLFGSKFSSCGCYLLLYTFFFFFLLAIGLPVSGDSKMTQKAESNFFSTDGL